MQDMKMTDHQNCKTWNCRTWNWRTNFRGIFKAWNCRTWKCRTWNCRTKYRAETRVAARPKCDAVSLLKQTHLTAVVYSCCRCRRWRGSHPSRCSRWCRGWWQVVCVIFIAGRLVVVSHRLDYFLCAQAGDLSPVCCDLPQSSNWSKNRHKRLLSLFRLRRLPLLS